VAEKVKIEFGSAVPAEIKKSQEINLRNVDAQEEETAVSRRHIAEIIEARMSEIFSLVNRQLKLLDRSGLLPAGVVLTGGGAKMHGVVELAKRELRLPAQIGFSGALPGIVEHLDDPAWAVATGLIFSSLDARQGKSRLPLPGLSSVGPTVARLRGWFRALLP
jgi:cell division protein FtsA